jgi:hypothetical protein
VGKFAIKLGDWEVQDLMRGWEFGGPMPLLTLIKAKFACSFTKYKIYILTRLKISQVKIKCHCNVNQEGIKLVSDAITALPPANVDADQSWPFRLTLIN